MPREAQPGFGLTALKIAWRELRSSPAKFIFVMIAVAAGVGSLTGVRGFSETFRTMLGRKARNLMAADISSRDFALPDSRQQAVLDSANHALQLAEERYRLGLSDQILVLTAENLVSQARRQMAALAADLATQRVTLFLAVGGGADPGVEEQKEGPAHDQ